MRRPRRGPEPAHRPSQAAGDHHLTRRAVLGGGTLGAAAAVLGALTPLTPFAKRASGADPLTQYFDILATGEALFTMSYQLAVQHHEALRLSGASLDAIRPSRPRRSST